MYSQVSQIHKKNYVVKFSEIVGFHSLMLYSFSAIKKHEGNKEYGKQTLFDTGEMHIKI